mmetsp:Transcript_14175/g.22087  ORF Transcript_14175/g.22087 Transcript_14175/m.22087 type:complete len:245 (+) Transcript_14175:265-999(+)
MEGFLDLVNLKKLYLEKNEISKLDGLDNCRKLEELYLGNQELAPTVEFSFDEYSLAAISSTLKILDLPNSNVVNPKPLYYLENIEHLNMKDNKIEDFEHQVCPLLQTMNQLYILQLNRNPVSVITKYRDQVVLLSRSIRELDGKDITDQERQYLVSLISRKKQGSMYADIKKKKEDLSKEMTVNGHHFQIHQQKKFLLENMGPHKTGGRDLDGIAETISFDNFKDMYYNKTGQLPDTDEEIEQL